jgi:tRNA A22 N-methylase
MFDLLFRFSKKIKKDQIIKKLSKITKNKISSGYYKSTYINTYDHRGQDLPSQLLGLYEYQVQEKIVELQKRKKFKYIINFGSADGFHILGLIKNNFFKKGIAFEIDLNTRNRLIKNIKKNNLVNKIKVCEKSNFDELQKIISYNDLKKRLFLIDIEGEEFNLFSKKNLKYFINSHLIIENHEVFLKRKEKIKKFYNILKKYFKIEKIVHASKNPFIIKEIEGLNEDEKWLSMSECRPRSQNWLVCYPNK